MFSLSRFIHLRRFSQLAAGTVPPSCGDDPRLFLFFLFFYFLFTFVAINGLLKRRVRLLPAPLSIHFREPCNLLKLNKR